MNSIHYRYQIVSSEIGETETFDLTTLSELTGLHEELIVEFARAHLVQTANRWEDTAAEERPVFDERGLMRLRQIAELRDNQHVSLRTLRLVVHLLDRLEAAETELRTLKEQLR
ncbi:MAG: chaperone modulator CbpM [Verrucomicrobiales bacterium]